MFIKSKTNCDHRVGDPIISFTLENCPRCLGKGIYGGFDFTTSGKINRITGVEVLKQKIEKILVEKKRPSGYGFDYDLINTLPENAENVIRYEISRCINYLIELQKKESFYGVTRSSTEEIHSLIGADVVLNSAEPRYVTIYVYVLSTAGSRVSLVKELRMR